MLTALYNAMFKIPELRSKIWFTLAMLGVYRLGHWIPIPGIDAEQVAKKIGMGGQGGLADISQMIALFSGGAVGQATIFGLGVMPYISASIIFQLLTSVSPALKKLQEEGSVGRMKINEWTRYATLALAVVQGFGILKILAATNFILAEQTQNPWWWITALTVMTSGTMFLMWIGEQIDKHGIGNGVSMLITAGILTRMPVAMYEVISDSPLRTSWPVELVLGRPPTSFEPRIQLVGVIALVAGFVIVTGGSVLMTVAQRRIPVQQAKHTRGRKVFGGQRSFLPLRVNHSGVMPVIFASSLMIFPLMIFQYISSQMQVSSPGTVTTNVFTWLYQQFSRGEFPYVVCEVILIYFFAYFWITVQFNPEEMSKQLREHGSFIPGLRPGPRTAEYLAAVMERITYVGAAFLAVIATIPTIVAQYYNISPSITQFLGGTGLLIVVSVVLDFMQRVDANLLMRNYSGFLGGAEGVKGPRMQSVGSM